MERSTTEAPWWDDMYETEYFNFTDIEPYVFTPHVAHERLVAFAVLAIFAVISSLCVLITVIRTESVRSQLLGVVLINLAVAVLLHDVILAKEMESEARGGVGNFGTVGCNFYYFAYTVSGFVIHVAIIIICIDTTFSLPQSRIVQNYYNGMCLGFIHHLYCHKFVCAWVRVRQSTKNKGKVVVL